ncbi:MAG: hypothetical protein ACJ76J_03485 [Thermoanaerobaculia bacterium]
MADDATNGWDVAYAMNLQQANALFLQQYLKNGPTNPATPLQALVPITGPEEWVLDVVLGPPKLAFQAGSDTATLEMELVQGWLTQVERRGQTFQVKSAVHLRPNESRLTGPLSLQKVAGEKDQLGQVMADLGASAYSPAIAGVDPGSVLKQEIGKAVKTFFANNGTQYLLATVAPDKALPACLNPTCFHFWTQSTADKGDACVLLLIRTDGAEGKVGALPAYPIEKGHSAALILAGRVVSELLVENLSRVFEPLGSRVGAQQNGALWKVSSSGGEINFGRIGKKDRNDLKTYFSMDSLQGEHEQEVRISTDGFTVQPSDGKLVARWEQDRKQCWGNYSDDWDRDTNYHDIRLRAHDSTIHVAYQQVGTPTVVSDEVEFKSEGDERDKDKKASITVTVRSDNEIERFLGMVINLPDVLRHTIRDKLRPILEQVQLPYVKTFALANLLFPSGHTVDLKEAELPGDLKLKGSMVPPVELAPAQASAAPGQRVPFKVVGRNASDFLWAICSDKGSDTGSIDEAGVYTAPESVDKAIVVIVTAVSKADAKNTGSAMVLVYRPPASGGVAVSPATVVAAPGALVELSTADAGGNPVAVTWKLPADGGEMDAGDETGEYTYSAPDRIDKAVEITAVAEIQGHPEKRGEARIRLVPKVKVTVSAAQPSVKPGGSVKLTAATDPKLESPKLRWFVDPPGTGSVEAQEGDRSRATYRAPKVAPAKKEVQVYAYLLDGGAGMASARITFTG